MNPNENRNLMEENENPEFNNDENYGEESREESSSII